MISIQIGTAITGFLLTTAAFFYLGYRSKIEYYLTRMNDLEQELKRTNRTLEIREEVIKILKLEVRRLKEHTKGLEAVVEDYHDRYVTDSKGRSLQ